MSDYVCASVKNLEQLKLDCDASLIRAIWKAKNVDEIADVYPDVGTMVKNNSGYYDNYLLELKRACVNHAGGYHGVEFLGSHRRSGDLVYYCNAGDTYAGTMIFNGRRLVVGTWGDMVERNQIKELKY